MSEVKLDNENKKMSASRKGEVKIRYIDNISVTIGRLTAFTAVMIGLVIIFEVIMRYVFNVPTRWAFDLTIQLAGFYFILMGAYALKEGGHVSIDIFVESVGENPRKILSLVGYLVYFFPFAIVITQKTIEFAHRSYLQKETTWGSIQIPVYPVKIAMAVAFLLLTMQGLSQVIKLIRVKENNK